MVNMKCDGSIAIDNNKRYKLKRDKKIKKILLQCIMLFPALFLFTVLLMNPVIQAVYQSFFEWNGIAKSPLVFKGLDNYKDIFTNKYFWGSLKNVGVFILQGILVQLPIAFGLALIVSQKIKGVRIYKTTFFLPVIIPLTAVGLMWTFILNPSWGFINEFIRFIGFQNFNTDFLGNIDIAIFSVVMVSAWVYAGYNMVIFAAGLTAIPNDIYEAAQIDGATSWRSLWHITIPLMKESFKIYTVLLITGSLKSFDLIYVMTMGGPNGATEVPAILMYKEAFKYNHFGYGNAIATVILILGLGFSVLANKYMFGDE